MVDTDEVEKHDNEHLRFELIENPPSNHPDLCAFLLLDKLFPAKQGKIISSADSYGIYLSFSPEEIATISEEDIIYLSRCGVFLNSEQCLYCFVG